MAKKKKSIEVQGSEITLLPKRGQDDYISLTDIMKKFDDESNKVQKENLS